MVYKNIVKRCLDVIFSIAGIIVGSVPMMLVAILIKTTSSGPVFFKQKRYGRNSQPFTMYKFRTMAIDAPIVANQYFNDMNSYVTPVGEFLRKTSLDELPQLWNVLKGDMSFVGPRPLADTDLEVIKLRQENGADTIRPGITGLAQVNGRNKITNEAKAMYDGDYANKLCIGMEIRIVWQTLRAVFLREGINHNDRS